MKLAILTGLVILALLLLGLIPAFIARRKGWSFVRWWIYGVLLFIVALPHALWMKANPRVELKPGRWPFVGQRLATVLTAEDWQFFAFIFSALLTLGFAVVDEIMETGWRRLMVKGAWSAAIGCLTLRSNWGRELLSRALPPFKKRTLR